jgi:high-affinity K+ transport system ATPase subunit B
VWPTHARRLDTAGDILSGEPTLVCRLVDGDEVLCVHGDVVPRDGEIVEGTAIIEDLNQRHATPTPRRSIARGARIDAGATVLSNYVIVRVGVRRSRFV